jgi:hypothetical protein
MSVRIRAALAFVFPFVAVFFIAFSPVVVFQKAMAQSPGQNPLATPTPQSSTPHVISNATAEVSPTELEKPETPWAGSESMDLALVRIAMAKSIHEETFEPVLETTLFHTTDYGIYAWLHLRTDYYGQTLRFNWRWVQPDGSYIDSTSPWWTFGDDAKAASWEYVYGYALPTGDWTVHFWVQTTSSNWIYLDSINFTLAVGTLCDQYLTNSGFEDGAAGWHTAGSVYIGGGKPHWDSQSAWLGGDNSQSYVLYQDVTLPLSFEESPTLALYYNLYTTDSEITAYDHLKIQVRDTENRLLRNLDVIDQRRYYHRYPQDVWQPLTWDLSDFAGQTIRLYFYATTDYSLPTTWYLDDISVTACPLEEPETPEMRLAKKFAPIVFIYPDDPYLPNELEVLVGDAELKQHRTGLPDLVIEPNPTLAIFDTSTYWAEWYYLDIKDKKPGEENVSYRNDYNKEKNKYQLVPYVHVDDQDPNETVIQYWLFYYFNDWWNKHEGDWELVQVMVDKEGNPTRAAYSQHVKIPFLPGGGTRLAWNDIPYKTDDTHPWVFVGKGSHASYFSPGPFIYPIDVDETSFDGIAILPPEVYDARIFDLPNTTLKTWAPNPIIITDTQPSWMNFQGTWGRGGWTPIPIVGSALSEAPKGPHWKGEKWGNPIGWANSLPLDSDWWLELNTSLGIIVNASAELHLYDAVGRHVGPNDSGGVDLEIPEAQYLISDTGVETAIIVPDADTGSGYTAVVQGTAGGVFDLLVALPDTYQGLLHRATFTEVPMTGVSIAELELRVTPAAQTITLSSPHLTLWLDQDGDGTFDTSRSPDSTTQGALDTTLPQAVTDLAVVADPIQPTTAHLTWTTPRDDTPDEPVAFYDLRYADSPISEENWEAATHIPDEPMPALPGSVTDYEVTGLKPFRTYYFAIRSFDEALNASAISNIAKLEGHGRAVYLPLVCRDAL